MAKYDYKSARTAIYTVLFGKQEHTYFDKEHRPKRRSNVPEHDETRQLSHFWEYSSAKQTFDELIYECKFTPERIAFLRQRLETLRAASKRKAETAH